MCEPFTARALFLSHAYLALLNDVRAKQLGFDAESPGRFEVLAAILSPHLVVILALLSRHDRAALLTAKWGVGGRAIKTSVARVGAETAMSLGRGAGRVAGTRVARRGAEAQRQRTAGGRGWPPPR